FGREDDSVREMKALNDDKFRVSLRAEWLAVGLFQALFFFEVLGVVAVLWLGGRWVLTGALTLGTLIMVIEYIRRLARIRARDRVPERLVLVLRQRRVRAAGRVLHDSARREVGDRRRDRGRQVLDPEPAAPVLRSAGG